MTLPGAYPLLANMLLLFLASSAVLAAKVTENFYEVLGVDRKASKESIKTAYRKMALKWHPDKHKDDKKNAEEKFRKIAQAYEVLNNEQSREQYDKFGTVGESEEGFEGDEQFDSFEDFLKANGFDFGFHDPGEVFQTAIAELDVETIFQTVFDKDGKPVPPEKLEENSAVRDLQEAANMGVKFEFQKNHEAKDGTMYRAVLRSDGEGGFSAYTEPLSEEDLMEMQMEEDGMQMEGGMEGMPEMMMMDMDGEGFPMGGEGIEMMDGYPEMMEGFPDDMEAFMGEGDMFGDGQYIDGMDEDEPPPDHEEL